MKWLRPVLVRAALLVFGVGMALGAAEVVARSIEPTSAISAPRKPGVDPKRSTVGWSVFEFVKPGVRAFMPGGALYRTNRHGFRGREYAVRKRAHVFRIVIVGDSVTMGSGVKEDEAYPAFLEQALNLGAVGKTRYEVLNLGVAGAHLGFVATRLESLGLRFDPDLIVYGWTLNDIEGNHYRRTSLPPEEVRTRRQVFETSPFARSALVRIVVPHWQALRDTLYPPPESYVRELRFNYLHNPEAWADFSAGLDRLARVQEERGVCVAVFLHTQLYSLNFLHPFFTIYQRVKEAARERDLLIIDSFHAHRGRSARSLWVGPENPHPNPRGHRVLAGALGVGLARAPSRCSGGARPIEAAEPARP